MILPLLKSKKFQLGFTLIELLIAVAIIVILVTIGAVSYTTVNRNARDSQRKSDLKKIQVALEEFKSDFGSYPDEKGGGGSPVVDNPSCKVDGLPTGSPLRAGDPFTCGGKTYIAKLPKDPLSQYEYYYEVNEDTGGGVEVPGWCDNPTNFAPGVNHGHCRQYTIWAHLENISDQAVTETTNDAICQIAKNVETVFNPDFVNYNYCIHSP